MPLRRSIKATTGPGKETEDGENHNLLWKVEGNKRPIGGEHVNEAAERLNGLIGRYQGPVDPTPHPASKLSVWLGKRQLLGGPRTSG